MSLMGYTDNQIGDMLESINIAIELIDTPSVIAGLELANDLLEGLLVEGRV